MSVLSPLSGLVEVELCVVLVLTLAVRLVPAELVEVVGWTSPPTSVTVCPTFCTTWPTPLRLLLLSLMLLPAPLTVLPTCVSRPFTGVPSPVNGLRDVLNAAKRTVHHSGGIGCQLGDGGAADR